MSPKQRAREAMRDARAASRFALRPAEIPGDVPETLINSTKERRRDAAVRAWEQAEEACRIAGLESDESFCARQVRTLVYG